MSSSTITLNHPLHLRRTPYGYRIDDSSNRRIALIHCRQRKADAVAAGLWTYEEGEELAKMIMQALSISGRASSK